MTQHQHSSTNQAGFDVSTPTRPKLPYQVFSDPADASRAAARDIATLIRQRASRNASCVLGLATGSTPVGIYEELVRLHRDEGLSFANVITFNLDEYFPMQPDSLQSYVRFMHEHLFSRVDIPAENIHIPDGMVANEDVDDYCRRYEAAIEDAGGIDLQIVGVGRTGHIGFNEPGSGTDTRTRVITLDSVTRTDAASDFFGVENVPRRAITMGVGTILEARRILLLAFGEGKASVVARSIEGEVSPTTPATFLQQHDNAVALLDDAASAELRDVRAPWLSGNQLEWDEVLTRRAAIWLSQLLEKPILMLTDSDYNEHRLQDLLAKYGSAYEINLLAFRYLQNTITGWPAGKPGRESIFPKRIVLFSPHPDDDVISMGGTLIRLADQGHEVHVAYQTSGNIAVFDDDATRFAKFAASFCQTFGVDDTAIQELAESMKRSLIEKGAGQIDTPEVQQLKSLIRRGEAEEGALVCGVPRERLHFLELPFYETGLVRKKPISQEDVDATVRLLQHIQPHQIYAAGDLSDPHGTHRTCLEVVKRACAECSDEPWMSECDIWLYRGAWQEWPPHEVEMAVPLSPQEVDRKRAAIFKHESQKDRALFPGPDSREFWQRAEARNAETANIYDRLGLAQYQAIEGFVELPTDQLVKVDPPQSIKAPRATRTPNRPSKVSDALSG